MQQCHTLLKSKFFATVPDSLIVWRIDRLGRSISHLVNIVNELKEQQIDFKSLSDGCIDTTTASGELMFNLFASLAQFERRLIQERVNAGLKSARSRGKKGGRPSLSPMDSNVITAKALHKDHNLSISEICKRMKISKAMLYRYLKV
uniref:recombinase family protein n=1 Tax=Piscirickettsia salmonis TaxID=1238 RepID=UPI0039F6E59D